MESQPLANPYHFSTVEVGMLPPFAGRQKAFEHLYQGLTDPERTHTSLILGRAGSGKTALLQQFNTFFDETFIGVYLPLKQLRLNNERALIRLLVNTTNQTLAESNYTLSRLPEFDESVLKAQEWFAGNYLPELMTILRRHRRMVYLLDDVDVLFQAIESNALPDDTTWFLNSLIEQFDLLGFVLTMHTRYEAETGKLSPLLEQENILRLANLNLEDVTWLLNEPAGGFYRIDEAGTAATFAATGGQPRLVQRFGFHLFQLWAKNPENTLLTLNEVKTITPQVYSLSEPELLAVWAETTRNERLVLTAISSLLYGDPLAAVNPAGIETWLVESDYPLDSTAINAAIRGLEYREIVEHTVSGIHLTAGLMQTWLLENARLTEQKPDTADRPRLQWLALVIVAVVVIALVLAASQGRTSPQTDTTPQPTVTLVTTPEN